VATAVNSVVLPGIPPAFGNTGAQILEQRLILVQRMSRLSLSEFLQHSVAELAQQKGVTAREIRPH